MNNLIYRCPPHTTVKAFGKTYKTLPDDNPKATTILVTDGKITSRIKQEHIEISSAHDPYLFRCKTVYATDIQPFKPTFTN